MKNFLVIFLTILSFFCISCADKHTGSIGVSDLRCEYRENPLGIENSTPGLGWLLYSSERNQKQSAYQVLVASSPEKLSNDIGDIWDSRKVKSDQSVQVPFGGEKLESCIRYYWKVRVWDKNGNRSEWSAPAYWEMGLLNSDDWNNAKWIGYRELPDSMRMVPGIGIPPNINDPEIGDRVKDRTVIPCFRKEFGVNGKISRARLFISGLGQYEATVNGNKVGTAFLAPGWTSYDKTVFYNCYDITNLLQDGINAIGVMVGNGFYYT